ncbi:Metallo-beta-lactamase superfamily protein [Flagellimonas taeanensis]|uniref:Metallo-beta-lactamase superfamily protein n=1 Tax=Flagellimonas taeanensis TaxID=1005926 RepID=A0A1M6Y6H8_9FLAO|nr:MBL fold metallo-hydrolase [Allomuricauda taeanensis]SFC05834.1 Metallo-beta-lactamase superfamily protein [Allomuricauda taeanensis]SHL13599.1 Metallo-beta-lactamase superfamily protein [Allomuricauda taeanensis]
MYINLKKSGVLATLFLMALVVKGQKQQLPAWEPGFLDIHHINTGRGDAAFMVFPDGTTMLVDAGDMSETHPRTTSSRNAELVPNRSKTTPQWIVDYMDQFLPKQQERKLDYALITHYHDDHFGEIDSLRKIAPGGYQLTGIMEVGTLIPIKKMIDRGFEFPINLKDPKVQAEERFSSDAYGMIPTLKEYWKFVDFQSKKVGLVNEALKVGRSDQIILKNNPKGYPTFSVRNIASNGNIWTGYDDSFYALFKQGEYPGENPLSNGIRIDYGKFNYYTGGDISGIDGMGQTDLDALESHVAPVIGPVDVATLNHHGNRDSQNPFYVRTIRPRVWIQQNWTADHPGEEVLRRITSTQLYPGERDIFSTIMLQGTKDVIGGRLDQYKSQKGHIVIRVYNHGNSYDIYVLNDSSEEREILAKHGPYEAR